MIRDPQIALFRRNNAARDVMPQGRNPKMLTTHQIREHFESVELERLRAEVRELQARINRLQSELMQYRQGADANVTNPPRIAAEE